MLKNNIFQNNLPYHFLVVPILKYTKKLETEFNDSFYLTEKNNNPYRQFYHTVPTQNKDAFQKYLFPNVESCKSSSSKCIPYNDIRIYNNKFI